MSWFLKILDVAGSNVAGVDANAQLKVGLPAALDSKIGYAAGADRIDGVGGLSLFRRRAISRFGQTLVAPDTMLFDDSFGITATNTSNWQAPGATQTVVYANNAAVLNGGNITTINSNSAIRSYRNIQLWGCAQTKVEFTAYFTAVPQVNATTEFGLIVATLAGGAAPTDGVYFRQNNAGELRGVVNSNGTETQTGAITSPSINTTHDFLIVIDQEGVEFWIDDVLQARIDFSVDTPAFGSAFGSMSAPIVARHYIAGVAPAVASQFRVFRARAWFTGAATNKLWHHQLAGLGGGSWNAPNGSAAGNTGNYANSTNPVAAVPTNTTAALGVGLGGQFWETDTLAVTTDGILCSYLNPLGTVLIQPRTLHINSVTVDSFVQTVLTGGGYVAQYSLAFGHTALSLATGESPTAKAPRRVPLGLQTVPAAAAALTLLPRVSQTFETPIVVNPTEFIQVVKKKIGTAPSAGVIGHIISFNGNFE